MAIITNVTGGMGSGKSYLCKLFKEKRVPVLDMDLETKNIFAENESIQYEMKRIFGNHIYSSKNNINSKLLSEKIFSDYILRKKVELLIKGELLRRIFNFAYNNMDAKIVIIESAIFIEANLVCIADNVILVNADMENRLKFLEENRGFSRKESMKRMKVQMPHNYKVDTLYEKNIPFEVYRNDYTEETAQKFINYFLKIQ